MAEREKPESIKQILEHAPKKPGLRKPRMDVNTLVQRDPSDCSTSNRAPSLDGQVSTPNRTPSLEKQSSIERQKKKFVFSPDAPEFVPRNVAPEVDPFEYCAPMEYRRPSMQGRLKVKDNSVLFGPKRNSFGAEETVANGLQNMQISGNVKTIVEALETFVHNLIKDPGLYDSILDTFMSFLNPYLSKPMMYLLDITNTASMLYNNSVGNINFRYNGARLCLTISEFSPEFQAHLLLLCEKDINYNSTNIGGLIMFIAELYMNTNDTTIIFGTMLVNAFDVLLSNQMEQNITTACQVLKLISSKFSKEHPANLEDLLHRLDQYKPSMRNNIQSLIESVKRNCQNQVDGTINGSDSNELVNQSANGMNEYSAEPIYIGVDGEEVAPEFLESYSGDDDDSDMEEMYAQYEEFLKLDK